MLRGRTSTEQYGETGSNYSVRTDNHFNDRSGTDLTPSLLELKTLNKAWVSAFESIADYIGMH